MALDLKDLLRRINWLPDKDKWFDARGNIIFTRDPFQDQANFDGVFDEIHLLPNDMNEDLKIEYKHNKVNHMLFDPILNKTVNPTDDSLELTLLVEKIRLDSHPLFNEENNWLVIFNGWYESYESKTKLQSISYLIGKMQAVEEQLRKDPENNHLRESLQSLQSKREEEEKEWNLVLWNVIHSWQNLVDIRTKNGYISTNLDLKIERDENVPTLQSLSISKSRNDGMISLSKQIPANERDRRKAIHDIKYTVEIYINDKLVTKLRSKKHMDLQFELEFNETLLVKVNNVPEFIKLVIYQESFVNRDLINTLFIPLPENYIANSSPREQFTFASKKEFTGLDVSKKGRIISGDVFVSSVWNKPLPQSKRGSGLYRKLMDDIASATEVEKDDPNSPIQETSFQPVTKKTGAFTIEAHPFKEFDFVKSSQIRSRAASALKLNRSVANVVAVNEKDRQFLDTVKNNKIIANMGLQRKTHIYDFIREERLPENDDEEFFLFKLFKVRRPLKPFKNDKKVRMKYNSKTASCKIQYKVCKPNGSS
jgi:hypothetical protein